MKKILFTFICLSQLIFSQDVLLSESGHDQTSLDIYIENTENVYGTQINIDVSGLVGCENVEFGGVLSGSLIDSKLLVSAKVPSEYMGIIKLDNEDLNYPMKSHMIDDLSTFGVQNKDNDTFIKNGVKKSSMRLMKDCIQDYYQEINMSNRNMHLVTWTSYKQDFVYYNDEKLPSPNSDADFHDVILSLGNGRLLRDWIALWGDN